MIAIKSRLLVPGLSAAALSLGMSPGASANVVGFLDIGSTGTVKVTASTITFSGGDTTTAATNLTYNSGTALGAGVSGMLKNLTGTLPVPGFMMFTGTPLAFDLESLGPGVSNLACGSLTVGMSCSVFAGSPFILTLTSAGTSVALAAAGIAHDATADVSTWSGIFTTQIAGETPAQIQTAFATPGTSVVSSFSGNFLATMNPIPEPNTAMLLGAALLGALVVVRRLSRS